MEHAFDRLGAMRVEFKTDARNARARAALAAIGGRFEGIFRRHMLMADGRVRDSAWYAVVDEDWPAVAGGAPRAARPIRGADDEPVRRAPIEVDDYHTGGEPFRIITGGVPALRGATVLERRRDALERLDHVRRLLVNEPRGHADMYGCHVTPPDDAGADLGRRLLPQRGLLDGLRARDDRPGDVGPRDRGASP